MSTRKILFAVIGLMSFFLSCYSISYPTFRIYSEFQNGTILISVPLLAMFVAGIIGIKMTYHVFREAIRK